ncbi:LEAF RUST 10 DISEASE-RESISTANCE LOCUS RECEPTOR-LIKE PROTEIN KINASE-like 1.1 isoform X1 [Chenopodium quinoa]|nr:LEAF RUST 10 DISEASE-RESISTANCE LOCUS RECEPTOR-LIKE PROTEIN KINASE-like 1.1 isoform X1 [Chenopodium quinoa]
MASAFVALIFFLLNFVQNLSAQDQKRHVCPTTFQCGTLGTFGYPLTTAFNPTCGICVINCTDTTPTIGLSPTGPWYEIKNSFSNNRSFLVSDALLEYVVNSDTCDAFKGKTISLPKSTAVIITTLWNETFWKCKRNFNLSSKGSFLRILKCRDYNIYHSNNSSEDGSKFSDCKSFKYPKFLIVELSDKCSHCVSKGGYCQETKPDKFQCINNRKERRRFRLLLGLGISGGIVVIIIFGLLFWCSKKIKLRSLELASGNNSKQTMRMKTNLEGSKVYFTVPVFSYSELEEATKNFDPSNELGDGGFGTVYYGKLKDRREVAVKRLYERNCRQIELYMNEIEILACLRHQNLVTLYGCTSRRSRELLLVYEYVPNGTVADHLVGDQAMCATLTWPVRMRIAIETATALSYLHASDVIHRDVKTQNILLDNNFSVKVADFGLSRLFPMDVTHISTAPQGTPGYLDPEYHQCYQLTDKSDVYSFGVVLVELISSMPAVDLTRKEDEINLSYYAMKRIQCCAFDDLVDKRLGFDSNYKVKRMITLVAELAFQCLQHKKEFRPSMDEVLETLRRIDSADYGVLKSIEKEDSADYKKSIEKEDSDAWLLSNAENLPSPNSVVM